MLDVRLVTFGEGPFERGECAQVFDKLNEVANQARCSLIANPTQAQFSDADLLILCISERSLDRAVNALGCIQDNVRKSCGILVPQDFTTCAQLSAAHKATPFLGVATTGGPREDISSMFLGAIVNRKKEIGVEGVVHLIGRVVAKKQRPRRQLLDYGKGREMYHGV